MIANNIMMRPPSTRRRRTPASHAKVVVVVGSIAIDAAAIAAAVFFVAIWCCLLLRADAFTSVTTPTTTTTKRRVQVPSSWMTTTTGSSTMGRRRHHRSLQYHHSTTPWLVAGSPPVLPLQASSSSSPSSDPTPTSTTATAIDTTSTTTTRTNRLDAVLAQLTTAFPFFVLGTAILALFYPSLLRWTNRGGWITIMLSAVMWGTGLTLTKDDFTVVLKQNLAAVPVGVLCQFSIMPLSAFLIGKTILWRGFATTTAAVAASTTTTTAAAAAASTIQLGRAAFLGLCLVGCSPGGTASNLVSLIAKADVALSVLLTSCSTVLASVATPLLVKLLVGSTIAVSGWTLCVATARVVLLPVMLGMFVNDKAPNLARSVSRFTPFCSVVLVSLICGGVVAENASLLRLSSRSATTAATAAATATPPAMLPFLVASVLGLHCLGFLAGYLVPKFGLGFSELTSRTISIETGMQNSALAVVLARSIGAPPIASLPGALSATVHSCLGSVLAAFWRGRDVAAAAAAAAAANPAAAAIITTTTTTQEAGGGGTVPPPSSPETPDDYPDLMI